MAGAVEYLTPEEVVARLRNVVKVKTLANWRSSQKNPGPPYTKIGGRILYPLIPFEEWERANTGKVVAEYGRKGAT